MSDPGLSYIQDVSKTIWNEFLNPQSPKTLVKRGRGRPSKKIAEGQHKLGDEDSSDKFRSLRPLTIHKIKLDFSEYIDEGVAMKKALENICELYNISYQQAYSICEKCK